MNELIQNNQEVVIGIAASIVGLVIDFIAGRAKWTPYIGLCKRVIDAVLKRKQ